MPLSGMRVLDFTQVVAGPFGTQLLGDMGAEVIKIESLAGDRSRSVGDDFQGMSSSFFNLNRNKKSLALNLKHPQGKAIVMELLSQSDVLVENFKPGAMERLGLGYTQLQPRFPGLVYCSISGFGQTGPRREDVAFDQIIQGYSGLMGATGSAESGPLRVGAPVADLVGGLYASQGILLALQERTRSGLGQWVDISMLDAMVSLLGFAAWEYLHTGRSLERSGNAHPTLAPSGSFMAADGAFNISLTGEVIWQRFCRVLGKEAWIIDPRFVDNAHRFAHRAELTEMINAILAKKSKTEWMACFGEMEVPCGLIHEPSEALADPQIQAREMVHRFSLAAADVAVVANPVKLSRTPAAYTASAPALGADTRGILTGLGYGDEEIKTLRREGVVGPALGKGGG